MAENFEPRWMRAKHSGVPHWIEAKDTGHPVYLVPRPICGAAGSTFIDGTPRLNRCTDCTQLLAQRTPGDDR